MKWFRKLSKWMEDHPFRVDLIATLGAVLIGVPLTAAIFGGPIIAAAWASLAMFVPLAWRRTRPVLSAVLIHSFALLHWLAAIPFILPADLAVLIAIYSVAGHGPPWAARAGLASGVLGSLLIGFSALQISHNYTAALIYAFTGIALVLAAWAMGTMRAARRERWEAVANRAVQLERDSEQQNRLAIAAERARIAREMHDVVAHSLSIIVAQADGGRYAAQTQPELASQSLATIADTGRAALGDMRKILGVLRSDHGEDDANTMPQPSLQNIRGLIAQSKDAGMRISFAEMGKAGPLPPGAEMALFRVCQEALTNVRKHAGPNPSVTVALRWEENFVRLLIKDDGRGAAATSDQVGHGLLGINERAGLFGAAVNAGPRTGGGFQVEFELPLPKKYEPSEEEIRWQKPR